MLSPRGTLVAMFIVSLGFFVMVGCFYFQCCFCLGGDLRTGTLSFASFFLDLQMTLKLKLRLNIKVTLLQQVEAQELLTIMFSTAGCYCNLMDRFCSGLQLKRLGDVMDSVQLHRVFSFIMKGAMQAHCL